jgi:hypothetical protein
MEKIWGLLRVSLSSKAGSLILALQEVLFNGKDFRPSSSFSKWWLKIVFD